MKRFALALLMTLAPILPPVAVAQGVLVDAVDYGDARSELAKMQAEAIAPVVQLNRSCSASIVYSNRDQKSGEVETLVLTAKHCVDGDEGHVMTIYAPAYKHNRIVNETAFKVKLTAVDYQSDLALLKLIDTDTYFPQVMKIAAGDTDMQEAEPVWIIGYSRAQSRGVTQGRFDSREYIPFPDEKKDGEYFHVSAEMTGGNSGGPLVHMNAAGDYEQIGVAFFNYPQAFFVSYFTPVDVIEAFLKRVAPEMYDGKTVAAK